MATARPRSWLQRDLRFPYNLTSLIVFRAARAVAAAAAEAAAAAAATAAALVLY